MCLERVSLYHLLIQCENHKNTKREFFSSFENYDTEVGFWVRIFDTQCIKTVCKYKHISVVRYMFS